VALALVGFCNVDVNPPGPLQLYVDPPDEFNEIVEPTQNGLPGEVAVATGSGATVIVDVAVATHISGAVTVTVYVAVDAGDTKIEAVVAPVLHR